MALHELAAGGNEEGECAVGVGQGYVDGLSGGIGRNGQGGVIGSVDAYVIIP